MCIFVQGNHYPGIVLGKKYIGARYLVRSKSLQNCTGRRVETLGWKRSFMLEWGSAFSGPPRRRGNVCQRLNRAKRRKSVGRAREFDERRNKGCKAPLASALEWISLAAHGALTKLMAKALVTDRGPLTFALATQSTCRIPVSCPNAPAEARGREFTMQKAQRTASSMPNSAPSTRNIFEGQATE